MEQPSLIESTESEHSDKCCFDDSACACYLDLSEDKIFEVEQNSSTSKMSVKGRLFEHRKFWSDIGANQWVLECISEGYKLPFRSFPLPAKFRNNTSAFKYSEFVSQAVIDLLADGRIRQIESEPCVVSPLSVADNVPGKLRLVLDLTYVNLHLAKQKIKYEDWKSFIQYVSPGGYLYKLDLQSGYHHLDVFVNHQTYLGFSWTLPGQNQPQWFTFTCVPFGLSSAPHAFTKCMRPLVGFIRAQGVKFVLFLDDGAGTNDNFSDCEQEARFVQNTFRSAGLVINEGKSDFSCSQCLEWLGLIWNLLQNKLEIPERRLLSLHNSLKKVLQSGYHVSARKLASIVGKIISMSPSLGNVCRLMTRQLHVVVNSRSSWDRKLYIGEDNLAVMEIIFWFENCRKLNGLRSIRLDVKPPEKLGFSDASAYAGASYIVHSSQKVAHRMWTEQEREKSSAYRELSALLHGLQSFVEDLSGRSVQWGTDSQNVVKITDIGSMKADLQRLAINIYAFCIQNNIRLHVTWFPRNNSDIVVADQLSRIVDYDDWKISKQCFEYFSHLHGPFTFDRFADCSNTHCPLFNSRFYSPGCMAVDAFCQDWSGYNNWVVPPVCLAGRCIVHFKTCRAKGMLVVPKWTSQIFYPMLFDGHADTTSIVKCLYEVSSLHGVLLPGSSSESVMHPDRLKRPLLFIWIDCSALQG